VGCTICKEELHHENKFPLLKGGVAQIPSIGPFSRKPLGGVTHGSLSKCENMRVL